MIQDLIPAGEQTAMYFHFELVLAAPYRDSLDRRDVTEIPAPGQSEVFGAR